MPVITQTADVGVARRLESQGRVYDDLDELEVTSRIFVFHS